MLEKCKQHPKNVSESVCASARKAAKEFSHLEQEMWRAPEEFGSKIQKTQIELSHSKQALNEQKKNKQSSKKELKKLKKDYQDKKQQVDEMLAVISSLGQAMV